jgi:hypothetical protein
MRKKWTNERLKEEALKYKNITAFRKGSRIAYETALRNGFIEEIRKLIKPGKKHKWSIDELKKLSIKYKTRKEFKEAHGGAYKAAVNSNYFDEITSHMPKPKR